MAVTKLRLYQDAIRMLADARLATISDEVETRFALDDAWASSVAFVLRQAPWRFALKTAALIGGLVPAPSFDTGYAYPADWLRTHAIKYAGSDGREHPINLREQGKVISVNVLAISAGLRIRYVSSGFADPEASDPVWPEHFAQAVAAYLAFSVAERVTGERGASNRMSQLFNQLLGEAVRLDAEPEDRWMPFQRDGTMLLGARDFLRRGNWRFAITDLGIDTGSFPGEPGIGGFDNSFAIPGGWLRTVKLFLTSAVIPECPFDIREQAGAWGTNADAFIARYVAWELGFDSSRWDEPFKAALLAYLEAGRPSGDAAPQEGQRQAPEWQRLLGLALEASAMPDDAWLRHQLSGRFQRAARDVLSQGYWQFAMKAVAASAGGTPFPGYSNAFTHPADRISTHALYIASAGREFPFDAREHEATWSANISFFTVRYVSTVGMDSTLWPEPFATAVLALCEMETAPAAEAQAAAAAFAGALAEAKRDYSVAPNVWLPHQLSGALDRASHEVLSQGFWRFAMKTVVAASGGTPAPGYSNAFTHPADRIRTQALYVAAAGQESPFDIREHDTHWSANVSAFTVRYVSTDGLSAVLWPEPFAKAVLALLDAETAPPEAAPHAWERFAAMLGEAQRAYSLPPDPWLGYQLDGAFEAGKRAVLEQGYWVYRDVDGVMHGLKERQYSYLDDQVSGQTAFAFPYRYPLPDDQFKTHALFVPWDGEEQPIAISETAHDWSTDAESFVARYVSTDVLDAANWPEAISRAVLAYLDWQAAAPDAVRARGEEYAAALAGARAAYSRQENDWLRFQLDGSFRAALKEELEKGRWRFAVRTVDLTPSTDPLPSDLSDGTVSSSYGYRFIWPNDMLRPLRVYYLRGTAPYADRLDVDYRDEQGAIHADYAALTVRYVSRLGMDPTKWTAAFRDALLAWLQYREARGDPAKAAIAQAKFAAYEAACHEAARLDDARDMPVVLGSRLTAARRGWGSSRARELGLRLLP